jgi:integrase
MAELIHLLDGLVVLYRRNRSARWQARLKLADRSWRRVSTKERDSVAAGKAAMKLYYDAEFKREHKMPQQTRRFGAVAEAAVKEMQSELDAGSGKSVYHSYISSTNHYLIPFFGRYNVDSITQPLLKRFDEWRKKRMNKTPVASTITNHNSAMNKVFDYALQRGWVTQVVLPKLVNKGRKSEARPAFTLEEYRSLLRKLPAWIAQARMTKSKQMRELLRDYIIILAHTGIRHGTEAQNLKWRHIDWHYKDGERYLRITVKGKTAKRSLIARANAEPSLQRIQSWFSDLAPLSFDDLLKKRVDQYVFRLRDGTRTEHLNQTFRQLMRDTGLAVGATSEKERTLYSLRHTYATLALMNGIGIHELARQMGTSVKMLEQHYSKITPELVAEKFGGKRYDKKTKTRTAKDKK